ncbi:pirin family protein [Streptomyces sp. NPDC001100]
MTGEPKLPRGPGRRLALAYEQLEIDGELLSGGLVTVASGRDRHQDMSAIRNRHAALHVARLRPGQQVVLPEAPYLHLFVARGSVELEGTSRLDEGDAVRFTATGGHRVDATGPSEILAREMHATFEL